MIVGVAGRVVVVGPVSWNRIVVLPRLPDARPQTLFALETYKTVGGTSAGKALHLAGLGHRVECLTVVGSDDAGRRLVQLLADAGVTVDAVMVAGPSESHCNLMTRRGERVSVYLSLPALGPGEPQGGDRFAGAGALVLDLSERARGLIPAAVEAGVPIWVDVHDYDGAAAFHRPFLAAADYLFMNADGMVDPLPFMRSRVEAGARAVVCTLGARGAVAVDAEGARHQVSAAPTAVRDTNGAGDAFMAGFLDATLAGAPIDDALDAASRQATVALRSPHLHPWLDDRVPVPPPATPK